MIKHSVLLSTLAVAVIGLSFAAQAAGTTANTSIKINSDGSYTTTGANAGLNTQTSAAPNTNKIMPPVQSGVTTQARVGMPATAPVTPSAQAPSAMTAQPAAAQPAQANTTTRAYGPRGWSWNNYHITNQMQNRKGVNE